MAAPVKDDFGGVAVEQVRDDFGGVAVEAEPARRDPSEAMRENQEALRRAKAEVVANMNPAEAIVTAFGENARHAIRQGANLLGKTPGVGKYLGAPTDEELLEESENLKPLNEAVPTFAALGHGSISVAPMVAAAPSLIPVGASLGSTALASGAMGAAQGLAFSGPGERVKSGAMGGALGAGAPLALAGAGAAARYGASKIPEPVKEWVVNAGGKAVDALPENVKAWLAAKFTGPASEAAPGAAVPGAARSAAESEAVRTAGADRTAYGKAFGRPANQEKVHKVGRFLLDEDLSLRSPARIQEGLAETIKRTGDEIGNLTKAATESGATVDLGQVVKTALQSPKIAVLTKNTETRPAYQRIVEFLEDKIGQGTTLTAEDAHGLRRELDALAKWDKRDPSKEALALAFRSIRGAVDDALGGAMDKAGLGKEWAAANTRYALARTAKGLADVGAEREAGNGLLSPTEKLAALGSAAGGAMTHDPKALALLPLYAAARRFGHPVAARTLDALARPVGSVTAGAGQGVAAAREAAPEFADLMAFLRSRGPRLVGTAADQGPEESHTQR